MIILWMVVSGLSKGIWWRGRIFYWEARWSWNCPRYERQNWGHLWKEYRGASGRRNRFFFLPYFIVSIHVNGLSRAFTRVPKNWFGSISTTKLCRWAKFHTPMLMKWTSCSIWRNTVIISSNTSTPKHPECRSPLSCMKAVSISQSSESSPIIQDRL